MSLLEDVFLEDEAGEAQELERVIEGDEYDDIPRSEGNSDNNSEKEDEAEEDKRRVDPTKAKPKKVVKNPRFILNPARLTGPRGIQVIPEHFSDFKFKGKGHEKEDLDLVLKKLEHWAYRLYPRFEFEDCLKKIETLGKKQPVMVHLHKIRSDQLTSEEAVVQKDSSDDEAVNAPPEEDEFDILLQQQIELARSTPAPNSAKKPGPVFSTPQPINKSPLTMPKGISSPSINDEQKERMLRNKQLAEEKRLARLKNSSNNRESNNAVSIVNTIPVIIETIEETTEIPKTRKLNRSNIIDSSDDEIEDIAINQSVMVDVHESRSDSTMSNSIMANQETGQNSEIENFKDISEEVQHDFNTVVNNENDSCGDIRKSVNLEADMSHSAMQNLEHIPGQISDNTDDSIVKNKDHDKIEQSETQDLNMRDLEQVSDKIDLKKDNIENSCKTFNLDSDDENGKLTGEDLLICNDMIEDNVEVEKTKEINDSATIDNCAFDETEINHTNRLVALVKSKDLQNQSLLNDKENINTNVDLELMDVDFSEDF